MQSSSPGNQQVAVGSSLGVIGVLGLVGAVLTAALWVGITSAVSRASKACGEFRDEIYYLCQQSVDSTTPHVPLPVMLYLMLLIAGSLTAVAGVVVLFWRTPTGQYLVLGGGAAMVLFAIVAEAQYRDSGRITYDLVAGLVISIAGGLMFLPRVRVLLGLPALTTTRPAGEFRGGPT